MGASIVVFTLVAGCSSSNGLFGDKDDVILPGKRESVLPESVSLATAVARETNPVEIPAARINPNWAQLGGTVGHVMQNLALSISAKPVWRVDAGAGSGEHGLSVAPPIVVAGRVFVLDAGGRVRAFDARSGVLVWSKSLVAGGDGSDTPGGGIASDGSHIYASTAFGDIVALSADNGEEIWRRSFTVPFRAAPTVSNGRLYAISVDNRVIVLSTGDGKTMWTFKGVGEQAAVLSAASPAVSAGVVVVPTSAGELIAFGTKDGVPRWTVTLSSLAGLSPVAGLNTVASPAIANGVVYAIAHSGHMAAFDLRDGHRLWECDIAGTQMPWVAGNSVFVLSDSSTLAAVSTRNGKVRWTLALPPDQLWSGPVMANGELILVSSQGQIARVSARSGEVLGRKTVGLASAVAPVIAGKTLYILTDDAMLAALR
ncbi:MAG: PQQ-binding-like beta-propeller repeat protein [Hyphomicrobiales bacterium]